MTSLPLDGMTIIELGQGVAAPYAGKMFADLGACVIKVEPPHTGDPARMLAPLRPDVDPPESSGMFAYLNMNKKSLTLDLNTEKGVSLAAGLCRKADVVIESFEPGTLVEYGLGFEKLHHLNPATHLLSVTWFGQNGPYRDFIGSDAMIYALSGLSYYVGPKEGPPTLLGGYQAQIIGGLTAFTAAMGAIVGQANGFDGQHIDVSIMEANLCFTETGAASFANSGEPGIRLGVNRFIPTYPGCALPCKDGWVGVTALTPAQWHGLCDLLDLPELKFKTDYATSLSRLEHADELEPILSTKLLERTADEWFHEGQARRIPFALVPSMADLLSSRHFAERRAFGQVHHKDLGLFKVPAVPFKLLKTPALTSGTAPQLGRHNREIMEEILGVSENELKHLKQEGII